MKIMLIVILILVGFVLSSGSAHAALITVDKAWSLNLNVLGYESEQQYELKQVPSALSGAQYSELSLKNDSGIVKLGLNGEDLNWDSSISQTKEEIVEIERTQEPDNIKIFSTQTGFNIKQQDYQATTNLPIIIDSKNKSLSAETKKGQEFLLVLPSEAGQAVVKSGTMTEVENNTLELTQTNEGQLIYEIKGKKVINLFNVFNMDIDVATSLDAGSGRVLSVDQPVWLSLFGFMLS